MGATREDETAQAARRGNWPFTSPAEYIRLAEEDGREARESGQWNSATAAAKDRGCWHDLAMRNAFFQGWNA